VNLSRTERLLLANQYKILEAVSEDDYDEKYYARCREIVERGYEGEYEHIADNVWPDTMTAEECREVVDTLAMYDMLQVSYGNLSADEQGTIDKYKVQFHGYDGNNEPEFMMYTEFFCKDDPPRFEEVVASGQFNSHAPMRGRYEAMLAAFEKVPKDRRYGQMTKDDIVAVTSAY